MRPVLKSAWPQDNGANKSYKPHTIAKPDLESNLHTFCSYCEVFSSDLEVEHVISQNQDSTLANDWNNFLLACGCCNGRGNKSNQFVDLATMHFPHRNNTLLSFIYKEGGLVEVNPALPGKSFDNAQRTLKLVGLDKYLGNPGYPKLNPNDTRWSHRRRAWENAKKYLPFYESGNLTAKQIADFAIERGFFSVWFTVFEAHPDVKKCLIDSFVGTHQNSFDSANGYQPICRNPVNTVDPV